MWTPWIHLNEDSLPTRSSASRLRLHLIAGAVCLLAVMPAPAEEQGRAQPPGYYEKQPPARLEKMAALYLKLGRTDDCRAAITALLHHDPRNLTALRTLARLELQLGHHDASVTAASSLLALSPDDDDATIIKSQALRASGHAAEADRLIGLLSPDVVAQREEALGLRTAKVSDGGEDAPSEEESRRELAADAADAALDKAREALSAGNLRQADALTTSALHQWPDNVNAIELRAEFLASADRPAEAVQFFRRLKAALSATAGPFQRQLDLAYALNDAGLTDEARRAFEVVTSNTAYSKEDRESAAKALAAQRADRLLAAGTAVLEKGDNAQAMRICEQLIKEKILPDDFDEFHADALEANGRHREAADIYAVMKKVVKPGTRFNSEGSYATALTGAGEYKKASYELGEMVASPWLYTVEETAWAREELEQMREKHLPGVAAEIVAGNYDEGRVVRLKSQYSSLSKGGWRYSANAEWNSISLDRKVFPTAKSEHQTSVTIGISREFTDQWKGSLFLGGCEQGVMASIAAEYATAKERSITTRLAYNDPARDSLLLEAMHGRQHSLGVDVALPLSRHFAFESNFLARAIEVEGENIGQSAGVEAQIRWHPFTLSRDVWLAYALELKTFDGNSGAFDRVTREFFGRGDDSLMPSIYDAVPKLINRHALQAHISRQVTSKLTAATTAEVAWRQEVQKIEYAVSGDLNWKLTPRCEVNARLEYESGGSGANSNGAVVIGTLGIKYSW